MQIVPTIRLRIGKKTTVKSFKMEENKPIELTTSTFIDKVKEKVKNQFVDLIPEEAWDGMIKKEIDSFFSGNSTVSFTITKANGWGNNSTTINFSEGINPFKALVWDVCFSEVRNKVYSDLTKQYINNEVGNNGEISENLKEVIKDSIPIAIQKYFEAMINNMGNNLVNMIQNNSQNVY